MGKHKDKSKKSKHKKNKKQKRKHSSSESSKDEWVEKKSYSSSSEEEKIKKLKKKRRRSSSSSSSSSYGEKRKSSSKKTITEKDDFLKKASKYELKDKFQDNNREDWMDMSGCFKTVSNDDKRKAREDKRNEEKQKEIYNPQTCSRELNPYWKDGGDGLPKFRKPEDEERDKNRSSYSSSSSYRRNDSVPNWKKKTQESKEKTLEYDKKESSKIEKSSVNDFKIDEDDSSEVLSEKELNMLASKLVKAEIMGNTKLVEELKEKIDNARKMRENNKNKPEVEDVILTHTDSKGMSQPVKLQSEYGETSNHRRKKNTETHKDGERVRYFPDDDKYSLKQMFEKEKYSTIEDQNKDFIRMANKTRKNDDLDDIFTDNIRKKESDDKIDSRNRDRAINQQQKISQTLDTCKHCIQSDLMLKNLMISVGETTYLSLPQYEPLNEGHCTIVPIRHTPCVTQLDENEWEEVLDFRKALVKYFLSRNEDVVFFETALSLQRFPHMIIQCIPIEKEIGELAPIYFKKAIDESETEWSQNKKLVSLKGRDVRKAIPKGLPYFFVSFGMEEGFAHVIEDESLFPSNFAQEIIGGMLDLHHSKWRKPKMQSFSEQSKRVLEFSKSWSKYDFTSKKY